MYTIPCLTGSNKAGLDQAPTNPSVLIIFALHKSGHANAELASLGGVLPLSSDEAC